jgi:hypothetical protein
MDLHKTKPLYPGLPVSSATPAGSRLALIAPGFWQSQRAKQRARKPGWLQSVHLCLF